MTYRLRRTGYRDGKKVLVSQLSDSFNDPQPALNDGPRKSIFEKLPREVIHFITELCPLSSQAALALCSRHLLLVVGSQSWVTLRSRREDERVILCELLGRDLPDQIFCHRCFIIHSATKRSGVCAMDVSKKIHPKFYFLDFQLAMQRDRLGLALLSFPKSLSRTSTVDIKGIMHQYSTVARISTSLLLRSQQWFVIPRGRELDIPITVCSHLIHDPKRPWSSPDRLGALIRCRVDHEPNSTRCRLIECEGVKHCFRCETEIQIHSKALEDGRNVVLITAWRDYGEGHSPEDQTWRDQVGSSKILQNFESTGGDIKRRFEGGDIFCFDSVLRKEAGKALFGPKTCPAPARVPSTPPPLPSISPKINKIKKKKQRRTTANSQSYGLYRGLGAHDDKCVPLPLESFK